MNHTYNDNVAVLRQQDPDFICEILGITTDDLVDALMDSNFIEYWTEENGEIEV